VTPGSEAAALLINAPLAADAATRSRIYALLAECFSYPAGTVLERWRTGTLDRLLREVLAGLPEPTMLLSPLLADAGDATDGLQLAYSRLFDVCGPRPAVSMLERRYRPGDEPEQPLWEDLLRCYRYFGLDFSRGGLRESPDHLLLELEFMHYLTFLEAGAQRGRDDLRRGQRDFLTAHLGRWCGPFAEALARQNEGGPYAALAILLRDVVMLDLDYLNELLGDDAEGVGCLKSL
jgi:DMSO reductase family type II enzyme chaperone